MTSTHRGVTVELPNYAVFAHAISARWTDIDVAERRADSVSGTGIVGSEQESKQSLPRQTAPAQNAEPVLGAIANTTLQFFGDDTTSQKIIEPGVCSDHVVSSGGNCSGSHLNALGTVRMRDSTRNGVQKRVELLGRRIESRRGFQNFLAENFPDLHLAGGCRMVAAELVAPGLPPFGTLDTSRRPVHVQLSFAITEGAFFHLKVPRMEFVYKRP
jgi:hypothetical protein